MILGALVTRPRTNISIRKRCLLINLNWFTTATKWIILTNPILEAQVNLDTCTFDPASKVLFLMGVTYKIVSNGNAETGRMSHFTILSYSLDKTSLLMQHTTAVWTLSEGQLQETWGLATAVPTLSLAQCTRNRYINASLCLTISLSRLTYSPEHSTDKTTNRVKFNILPPVYQTL
jgi:hypothetical protein